jgi:hypothetical protein
MSAFSTPARLMVRPFRAYADVANLDEGEGRPTVIVGMLRFLFVFGAFIALIATGRLAPIELASAMLSFAYVPINHFMAVTIATRIVAPEVKPTRAFALYAEGYGPWFLFMMTMSGAVLFAPSPARLLSPITAVFLLVTIGWSGVITFACFRSGLALARRRAALATAVHYVVVSTLLLGYYIAAGQLLPILGL